MPSENSLPPPLRGDPRKNGRLIGQKGAAEAEKTSRPFASDASYTGASEIARCSIRQIDSKFRGCDLVRLKLDDVCADARVSDRGTVIQK